MIFFFSLKFVNYKSYFIEWKNYIFFCFHPHNYKIILLSSFPLGKILKQMWNISLFIAIAQKLLNFYETFIRFHCFPVEEFLLLFLTIPIFSKFGDNFSLSQNSTAAIWRRANPFSNMWVLTPFRIVKNWLPRTSLFTCSQILVMWSPSVNNWWWLNDDSRYFSLKCFFYKW